MINGIVEKVGSDHASLADTGCNGEPFRQVISYTDTGFTVGVEEFSEVAEIWGSARDAGDVSEGYTANAVEGGYKIDEYYV